MYICFDKIKTKQLLKIMEEAINRIKRWQYYNDDSLTLNLCHLDLTELPPIPEGVRSLYCTFNKLTKIDNLPNSLSILYCSMNNIKNLDNLPPNLQILHCQYNKIQYLDNLPNDLRILYCNHNLLTSVDHLPNSLRILYCEYNLITSLTNLPDNLTFIECHRNFISHIHKLPPKLNKIHTDKIRYHICSLGCSCSKMYKFYEHRLYKTQYYGYYKPVLSRLVHESLLSSELYDFMDVPVSRCYERYG